MEKRKVTIRNGDEVRCFNGNQGIVKSFNSRNYCLMLEYNNFEIETHLMNVCSINGVGIDPTFDQISFAMLEG